MTAIPLQNQYLSALLLLILHTSALQLLLLRKTFWCSSTERLYTVKWQRAMTEVTLTGVTVMSCTLVHKGLTGWKTITSCQVWILWCFKLPEIPQRTCYFLHRLLLSCFNSMKDETFCSLSHFGSCTLWHCCAARCVPRTPFPTHPAQPYRWGAPWTPSPRTAAPLSPHEPRRVGFSWQDHVVQAPADHGAVWAVLMILKTKQDVRLRVHLHIQSNRTQDKRREGFFFNEGGKKGRTE